MKCANVMVLILLCVAAGCAKTPRANFYLVPDPEGRVGEVTVTNQAASVTLNKANETVAAMRVDQAFKESRMATSEEIETKFGDALALVPPPPKGFNIYFHTDSSKVDADSLPMFEQVLAEVRQRDSHDISLNGHTDRTGEADWNMKLSLERANAVKVLLVEQGVSADYLTIEYYGESKPVIPTEDNVSEPKNRRVEVVVR
ncbi:MAG TPA: OmpA family protein [Candidatus Hydrogenedentes bacterium]|nr:OmpA family protein [Candidatus Hydrogenedentota bacterium]HQH54474.1 OmpA family protein [Candidatus Hydrogenedentota bacterium]